jgi:lipopolysaccharide/colanic/teichoic acid biosynthesis glycosyltransferase
MLIAAGIKIFSPGPALFTQERVGLLSRTFTLWKFRTMDVNADQSIHKKHLHYLIRSESPLKKLDEESDPRIFPFGNLLRQFGLDELPQLINVLRGEMSLIGPRPCIPYEAEELFLWHRRRFDCLPGLTGLWQVSGKNRTTYSSMMRLDIRYASNVSLRRDVKILLKTIPSVIAQAYEQPIEEGGKEYAGTN